MSKGPRIDFTKNPYPDDRLKLDTCPVCGRTGRIVNDPLVDGAKVTIHVGRYEDKAFIALDRCLIPIGTPAQQPSKATDAGE
jgi:hypothetical protein